MSTEPEHYLLAQDLVWLYYGRLRLTLSFANFPRKTHFWFFDLEFTLTLLLEKHFFTLQQHVKMYNLSLWCMRISQNLLNRSNFFYLFCFRFFGFLILVTFYSSYPFFSPKKVWTLSLENPEKGILISYRCIGLFKQRFCTKNGSCYSLIGTVRTQPIFKMNSPIRRSIQALSETYPKNSLTCCLMTSQVVR